LHHSVKKRNELNSHLPKDQFNELHLLMGFFCILLDHGENSIAKQNFRLLG